MERELIEADPAAAPQPVHLQFHGANGAAAAMILSPTTRRRQRGRGVVVLDNVTAASNMTNATAFTPEFLNSMNPLMMGMRGLSAGPSPDELVIQARGRRKIPLTFSPDVHHTPLRSRPGLSSLASIPRGHLGVARLLLPTRTSPRKRLTLSDSPPDRSSTRVCSVFETPSPEAKLTQRSPIAKKCRLELETQLSPDQGRVGAPVATLLKGLSQAQLANLWAKMLGQHPELECELTEMLPQPDLVPMEERLNYLKRNVFKSLPNTRLESKTDSMAYNRVSTHLMALKKGLADQSKQLTESCQWGAAVDHTLMAWSYVKATPVWDNPPHNGIRRQCFKILAVNCLHALKKGEWSVSLATDIKNRLIPMEKDSEEIAPCLKHLQGMIDNNQEIINPKN